MEVLKHDRYEKRKTKRENKGMLLTCFKENKLKYIHYDTGKLKVLIYIDYRRPQRIRKREKFFTVLTRNCNNSFKLVQKRI